MIFLKRKQAVEESLKMDFFFFVKGLNTSGEF